MNQDKSKKIKEREDFIFYLSFFYLSFPEDIT